MVPMTGFKNFITALMSNTSTGKALMIRPVQSIFFDTGAGWVADCMSFSSIIKRRLNTSRFHHLSSAPALRGAIHTGGQLIRGAGVCDQLCSARKTPAACICLPSEHNW